MVEVAEDCVRARQRKIDCGEDIGRIDMLAKLFDIREAHAKTKVGGAIDSFPFASIVQESFVGIFAGSDTTAIALRSIIYHLMKRPDSYQKLHSEIVAAVEAGDLLRDADAGYIRYADAIKLPYLLACCKEGMRLHPSVSMSMPRHVPVGGAEIAGRWFQGGDKVGVNAAVVHYDTTIFGDDVDVFRPERWFDGIKDAKLMDSHMLHFSAGPRTCLGKNIALVEIYKLIPQLVWEFDMELAHPDKEWVTNNVFLNKQTGIWVKVRKRERVAAFLDV
jgi:cytochrome P450